MEELRKQCMTWLERTNPLRGLSLSRASSIYDMARVYGSPRLQYMYNEIELTDPVLLVCADRRESALAGLEWSFVPRANADQTLAQEQADALGRFADEIDNFGELLRHLDSAFFRGFAHAQPIWDGKLVAHVSLLDSWNFLTDRDGNWYWNPRCHETPSGLETVEGARLVSLAHRRSIDYPALFIYIRKALGERDYGRFIERHGIPHAAVIMAPGTEEKDKPQYLAAANAWNNGQDIVLPNAAGINLATEARGTDPFTPFIDHQDKGIVLLATGGTLTSLAQADTGSLAGGAQMEVWREIVARDGVAVADALNRHLFRRYLELEFPGRPMAAKFTLSNEKKPTAGEIADLAVKIKSAGYTVDQAQLEEKTGLKLVKDETPAPQLGMGAPFMNKEVKKVERRDGGGENPPSTSTSSLDLIEAFAKDTGPAAEAVKALLKTIESGGDAKAEAASLIEKLPDLMPEDPAMAAVIAEAMAAEFAEVASHPSQESQSSQEPITNKGKKRGVCTSPNGPAGCKSPTCPGRRGDKHSHAGKHQAPSFVPDPDRARRKIISSVAHGMSIKALSDPSFNDVAGIGFVPSSVAIAVAQSTKGPNQVDIDGFRQVIPASRIRKADKKHGARRRGPDGEQYGEMRPEQKPLSQSDYDRIAIVKTSPDFIHLGSPRQGLPMVQYTKKFNDGTITTVWEVSKSAKQERFYDMWKK